MKYFVVGALNLVFFFTASAYGSGEKSKFIDDFDLKPVVFDSEGSKNSTLGLDFNIAGKFLNEKFESESEDTDEINPEEVIGGYDVSYSLRGLLAENSSKNPKDFNELRFSANYLRSSSFSFKTGFFIKSESDQKFSEFQLAYGLTATYVNMDAFSQNDTLALHFNLGQVDPSDDSSREAVLGDDLESYERADFEILYMYNIGSENIDTFEVNYRYFQELDPERIIKDSDLDRFRLVTYRLGFKNKFYVAYSSGELPFNQKDNQIYEIGYSYKFE